jgi:excinuclease ABC subunit A
LGPEGGAKGGTILCEGTPEKVAKCKNSYTATFVKGRVKAKVLIKQSAICLKLHHM